MRGPGGGRGRGDRNVMYGMYKQKPRTSNQHRKLMSLYDIFQMDKLPRQMRSIISHGYTGNIGLEGYKEARDLT